MPKGHVKGGLSYWTILLSLGRLPVLSPGRLWLCVIAAAALGAGLSSG